MKKLFNYNPNMSLSLAVLIYAGLFSINVNVCRASPIIAPSITKVLRHAHPFVVSIQLKYVDKKSDAPPRFIHCCGGSLITRRHVLTSAHCYRSKHKSGGYRVLVGSNDLKSKQAYYVRSWLTYDKWASMNLNDLAEYSENDIAIVELSSLVDPEIKLAKMTTASDDELRDQHVLSAGWGRMRDGHLPRYMVEVHLKMISHEECLRNIEAALENPKKPKNTVELAENVFCTKGDPYAILDCGDSGSPVFWKRNEIIGINAAYCPAPKFGMLTTKEQNIHVNVRLYSDFISAVNENCTIVESTSVSHCWIV